jgi:hypothetical protein
MIAWSAPSPSSPAPSARRYAALGLDRSVRPSKVRRHVNNGSLSHAPHESFASKQMCASHGERTRPLKRLSLKNLQAFSKSHAGWKFKELQTV